MDLLHTTPRKNCLLIPSLFSWSIAGWVQITCRRPDPTRSRKFEQGQHRHHQNSRVHPPISRPERQRRSRGTGSVLLSHSIPFEAPATSRGLIGIHLALKQSSLAATSSASGKDSCLSSYRHGASNQSTARHSHSPHSPDCALLSLQSCALEAAVSCRRRHHRHFANRLFASTDKNTHHTIPDARARELALQSVDAADRDAGRTEYFHVASVRRNDLLRREVS